MKNSTTFFRMISVVLLGLLVTSLSAQNSLSTNIALTDFTGAPHQNLGAGQWTFFTAAVQVDGKNLPTNTWIGVFDGTKCVGSYKLQQPATQKNMYSNQWIAYESSGSHTNGYTAGNNFQFKYWDATSLSAKDLDVSWNSVVGNGYEDLTKFPAANSYLWSYPELTAWASGTMFGILKGTVSNGDTPALGIQYVTISIAGLDITATTDNNGKYSFAKVPTNSSYSVTASYPSFTPVTNSGVAISNGGTTTSDFTLAAAVPSGTGSMEGYVRSIADNGDTIGINGVTVSTYYDNAIQKQTTATGGSPSNPGYYKFSTIPAATYALSLKAPGFKNTSSSSKEVTNGITVMNKNIFMPHDYHWVVKGSTDPFDNIWTIYLNNVKNGSDYKAGDEVGIFVEGTTGNNISAFANGAPGLVNVSYTADVNHPLHVGDSVVISGTSGAYDGSTSHYYDGTFKISALSTGVFSITAVHGLGSITGNWSRKDKLVGVYHLNGPISSAGTTSPLIAYGTLHNSTGFALNDKYVFKVFVSGGNESISPTSGWTTGYTVPAGGKFPSFTSTTKSIYSQVDLTFAAPTDKLFVTFKDEEGNSLLSTDMVTAVLAKVSGSGTYSTTTHTQAGNTTFTFTNVPEAVTYKLSVSCNYFIDTVYANITVANGLNTTKQYTIIHAAAETQNIHLSAGYQIISRRVGKDAMLMKKMLDSHFKNTSLGFIKDQSGASHSPGTLPDTWSSFDWESSQGYIFKMNNADDISITGLPITYSKPITVNAGYNLIPYYPDYFLNADAAFSGLKVISDLDYIRDSKGYSYYYNTATSSWQNDIGTVGPGEGFLVKWKTGATAATLTYPVKPIIHQGLKSVRDVDRTTTHFKFAGGNPMTNVYSIYIKSDELVEGDEVAIYDDTTLVGTTKIISSTNPSQNVLLAFAELSSGPGYRYGDPITLVAWKAKENKTFTTVHFTNTTASDGSRAYLGTTFPNGDARFSDFTITLSTTGISNEMSRLITVYPNPSSGQVKISAPQVIEHIQLLNLMGQKLFESTPRAKQTVLNISSYHAGIYFLNMIVNGHLITKKIAVR